MAENTEDKTPPVAPPVQPAKRAGRNISFTLPSLPSISWRNIAGRTKLFGAIGVLLLGLIGGYLGASLQDSFDDGLLSSSLSDEAKIITEESQLISRIAKDVGPSVVSVNVTVAAAEASEYSRFFGFEPEESQGAGTGIIISKSGLVLTNRHVVPEGTTEVSVTLSDGTELEKVSVVGRTSDSDSLDIAILKINDTEGKTLKPALLGDSSKVAVGDEVVAIGNALGQFQNTITSGIISGYGRNIVAGSGRYAEDTESLDNLFQTDAAINQGNSGGPLVNLNGQVIGVNTAVASQSQNIGFAIPINDVRGLVARVIRTGKFERPFLGVRYISLTDDLAETYSLSVKRGAYIAPAADGEISVVEGSAAAKAGLKVGDIITRVGNTAIDETHSLTSVLGQYQPGDSVKLTVLNGKDTRTVTVKLGVAPTD